MKCTNGTIEISKLLPRQRSNLELLRRMMQLAAPAINQASCIPMHTAYPRPMVGILAVVACPWARPRVLLRCVTRSVYHHKPPPSLENSPLKAQQIHEKHRPNGLEKHRPNGLSLNIAMDQYEDGWRTLSNLSNHQRRGPKATWQRVNPGNGSAYWEERPRARHEA